MENKYKFYKFYVNEDKGEVIAVTRYGGRAIKGIAKCSPEDIFNLELGKRIAVARAERKVAKAKLRNASVKYCEAAAAADAAVKRYEKMKQYYIDSVDQLDETTEILSSLEI